MGLGVHYFQTNPSVHIVGSLTSKVPSTIQSIQLSMHIVHCVATCKILQDCIESAKDICYIPIIHHYSSIFINLFIIIHLNLMHFFEPPSFSKYSPNFHAPHTPMPKILLSGLCSTPVPKCTSKRPRLAGGWPPDIRPPKVEIHRMS